MNFVSVERWNLSLHETIASGCLPLIAVELFIARVAVAFSPLSLKSEENYH